MNDAIRAALSRDDFEVVEQFEVPGRSARHGSIPPYLFGSPVGRYLRDTLRDALPASQLTRPLWRHQTDALNALGQGKNVVVSTGTASGKSLIFRALAFHHLFEVPASRVVVFYPLKALAGDQTAGWPRMAAALGMAEGTIGRIDSSVPTASRDQILRDARIVVMTPDVCHALRRDPASGLRGHAALGHPDSGGVAVMIGLGLLRSVALPDDGPLARAGGDAVFRLETQGAAPEPIDGSKLAPEAVAEAAESAADAADILAEAAGTAADYADTFSDATACLSGPGADA